MIFCNDYFIADQAHVDGSKLIILFDPSVRVTIAHAGNKVRRVYSAPTFIYGRLLIHTTVWETNYRPAIILQQNTEEQFPALYILMKSNTLVNLSRHTRDVGDVINVMENTDIMKEMGSIELALKFLKVVL